MVTSGHKCSVFSKFTNVLSIPNVSNVPHDLNAPDVLNVSNVPKVPDVPNVSNVQMVHMSQKVAKVDVQTLLLLEKSQLFIVEKYFFQPFLESKDFFVLISGYPRFLTQLFYMTLGSLGQGHGGNNLG